MSPAVASERDQVEGCLRRLTERMASAVEARRAAGSLASPRQGLIVTDTDVERMLVGLRGAGPLPAPRAPIYEPAADETRLDRLVLEVGLGPLEADALFVALAPDLDPRIERLNGYLQDDVSRLRPSVGLALELCGGDPWSAVDRALLGPAGAMVRAGLVELTDPDRPLPTRGIRAADRVVDHVLGGDRPDPLVRQIATEVVGLPVEGHLDVAQAVRSGARTIWVHQPVGHAGASMVSAGLQEVGPAPFAVDLTSLPVGEHGLDLFVAVLREAVLAGRPLLVVGVEQGTPLAAAALDDQPVVVVLVSASPPDVTTSTLPMSMLTAGEAGTDVRRRAWSRVVTMTAAPVDEAEVDALARTYRLTPEQIDRAGQVAVAATTGRDRRPDVAALKSAVRGLDNRRFERLAQRIEPAATLDDLVVPVGVRALLDDIVARVRHREVVIDAWGMARGNRRRGTSALFSGPSGAGKTLSAEAVAGELDLDLYVIDLSQVVDKYVGETEKNLERIFAAAEGVNAVLFFDEADALFGKRSDVRDAQDRHANVEVAYLLQRMEVFEGVVLLSTNLPANLDEAFSRRLDVIVRYELPTPDERRELWRRHLPATLPLADDVDIELLTRVVEVSGGVIANICRSAAFAAAADSGEDGVVTMADLVRAVGREQTKQGRLRNHADFGRWAEAFDAWG